MADSVAARTPRVDTVSRLSARERAAAWLSALPAEVAPKGLPKGHAADFSLGRDIGVTVKVLPYGPGGEVRATVRTLLAYALDSVRDHLASPHYLAQYEPGLTVPEDGELERELRRALLHGAAPSLCSRHRGEDPASGRVCLQHGICLTPAHGVLGEGYGPLVDLAPAPHDGTDDDVPPGEHLFERIRAVLTDAAAEHATVADPDEFLHWWLLLLDDECAGRSETVDVEGTAELARSAEALRTWSRVTVLNTFGPLLHEDLLGADTG